MNSGPGYVVSIEFAALISELATAGQLMRWRLEDVSVGLWVQAAKAEHNLPIRLIHDKGFTFEGCVKATVSHSCSPHKMKILYQGWLDIERSQPESIQYE